MSNNKNIVKYSLSLFFLLMLVLPASFQAPRGLFLGLILLFSLRSDLLHRLVFDRPTVYLAILNIGASIFFIIYGFVLSAPGALSVSTVYVIWPILYFYFIGFNSKLEDILPFMKMILYGCIIAAILVSLFILNTFVGIPGVSAVASAQDFTVGFYDGFIELNSMNLATIMYAFSFSLTIVLLPMDLNFFGSGKMKTINFISLAVSLLLILISARRAFWVVCLVCPIIIIALFKLSGIRINLQKYLMPFIGFMLFAGLTFSLLALDLTVISTEFDTAFEFDNPDAESNYLRKEQYDALVNGWMDSPFLGQGLGATAKGSIRDEAAPWAYELSYMALLFQTGIIGMCIYGGSILWIYFKSIKIMRSKNSLAVFMLAPQLIGLTCFLIVNASNPYLAKFDYLWTVFLPIATINAFSLNKESIKTK